MSTCWTEEIAEPPDRLTSERWGRPEDKYRFAEDKALPDGPEMGKAALEEV